MIRQLSLDRALKIDGWMTEGELSFLAEQAEDRKTIFEIGSYCGRSARVLADNSSSDCKIYCIDPWNSQIFWKNNTMITTNDSTFGWFQCNLYDHLKSKKVIPVVKCWSDWYPVPKIKADFIFIDGDHTYEIVKGDINKALGCLNSGGILAGHDYNWSAVEKAVNETLISNRFEVKSVETIWWTKKY